MNIHRTDAGLVSDTNLCLTKQGEVVEASDPRAHCVLINAGKVIPMEMIKRFGLKPTKGKEERAAPVKATEAPPAAEEPPPSPEQKGSVHFTKAEEPSAAGQHGSLKVSKGK